MKIAGIDWDENNWPKCGKHGVSQSEIEEVLTTAPAVMPDPYPDEPRLRAIGRTTAGRYVFLVFMPRQINGATWLRPISARYMLEPESFMTQSTAISPGTASASFRLVAHPHRTGKYVSGVLGHETPQLQHL